MIVVSGYIFFQLYPRRFDGFDKLRITIGLELLVLIAGRILVCNPAYSSATILGDTFVPSSEVQPCR